MNKSAFEHHVSSWRMKAVKVCRSCGADSEEAEDIAQEVMLRLWQMHQDLERFQSVEAIVSLMARHMLRNHQRRKPTEQLSEAVTLSLTTGPHEELVDKVPILLKDSVRDVGLQPSRNCS